MVSMRRKSLTLPTRTKTSPYKVGEQCRYAEISCWQRDSVFVNEDSPEAFELLNHSTSHLMAQAIIHLYPKAKFGFGPAIEEGYYYDVDFGDQVITEADFPRSKRK
jgi:threonyl-tRNA synthetase